MNKVSTVVALTLIAVTLHLTNATDAEARPPYKKQFEARYKDPQIVAAVKEAKCNVCHYGKSKKNRNDYGSALSKLVTKDTYKELRKDKEALAKKVDEAMAKVEKEKSEGGSAFGDLLKEGKLPGTPPAE